MLARESFEAIRCLWFLTHRKKTQTLRRKATELTRVRISLVETIFTQVALLGSGYATVFPRPSRTW